eukprot:m.307033 g.307033  ORF g.307033 m.307033 type:complete len:542 (+) comp41839_c0_seq1:197-1822(+)
MPIRRQIKNVVNNYTEGEVKVREATSNDPWGPSSTLMSEIADSTYNVMEFGPVMTMLWRRLNDSGKNWRHVYKALVVLDYLIKTGSERVYQQSREHVFTIQTLKDFQFVDKDGKDQGLNVREKAKQLVALLKDDERLKSEREKALKAKERFAQANTAISSSDVGVKFGKKPGTKAPTVARTVTPTSSYQQPAPERPAPVPAAVQSGQPPQIEQSRPSDTAEEDMQLQLALALSRQQVEHEKEMRMVEEDRIHRAIVQSRVVGNNGQGPAVQTKGTLLDLSAKSGFESDFVPAAAAAADPWSAQKPGAAEDPWAPASNARKAPVWESMDTPFGAGPSGQPAASKQVQSPVAHPVAQPADPFGGASVSNDFQPVAAPAAFDMTPLQQSLSAPVPQPEEQPKAFLGDHSGLVNVDSLLGHKSSVPFAATANPFLASSSTVSAPAFGGVPKMSQAGNPFSQIQKPKTKTLNELRTQSSMGYTSGPSEPFLPPPLVPDSSVRSNQPAPGLTYQSQPQQTGFIGGAPGFGAPIQPMPSQGNPFGAQW